jgi:hypothetical protein
MYFLKFIGRTKSKKGNYVSETWFEVVPNVSTYATLDYNRLTLQNLREVLMAVTAHISGVSF